MNSIISDEKENLLILSDEPSLSSASLCTMLHLGDQSFRPEFTHQCLPQEFYPGHCPLNATVQSHPLYDPQALLHKSHRFQSQASYHLDVKIHLAPSGRQCQVLVHRTRIEQEPSAKKTNREMMQPMTEEEIKASISKALPTITNENCDDDYLKELIGTVLVEYPNAGHDFVMTIADGRLAAEYHSQIQRLSLWFIENADEVDVADDQSGFWNVMYLFRKQNEKYSLAGYMTLFHFHAPFHKPSPGIIARVCQALVLPPYQGQGHGTKLMECLLDMAQGQHSAIYPHNIVQVNVEDPSPGFIFLRNIVDYQYLTHPDHRSWWLTFPHTIDDLLNGDDTAFSALSDQDALRMSTQAKITPRQVQLVYELMHLQLLTSNTDEQMETCFRLMVKKRLNREHKEDMLIYPTKEEKKAFLSRLYEDTIKPYKIWMAKRQNRLQ